LVSANIQPTTTTIAFYDGRLADANILRDINNHAHINTVWFGPNLVVEHSEDLDREWSAIFDKGHVTGLAFSNIAVSLASGVRPSHCLRKFLGPICRLKTQRMKTIVFGGVTPNLVGTVTEYSAKLNTLKWCVKFHSDCAPASVGRILAAVKHNYRIGKALNDAERAELEGKDAIDMRYEGFGRTMTPATPIQRAEMRALSVRNSDDNAVIQDKQVQLAEVQRRLALGVTHKRIHDILSADV